MTEHTASIEQLQNDPLNVIESANGEAVAILKGNKPIFYAVPVDLFERMFDMIDDAKLAQIVQNRQQQNSIKTSIDEL